MKLATVEVAFIVSDQTSGADAAMYVRESVESHGGSLRMSDYMFGSKKVLSARTIKIRAEKDHE